MPSEITSLALMGAAYKHGSKETIICVCVNVCTFMMVLLVVVTRSKVSIFK